MQAQSSQFDPSQLPPRVASKIAVDENGCWLWTASRTGHGYGEIYVGSKLGASKPIRRKTMAHRLVYELLVGPISEGLEIDHLCRVRCCVNPKHLEPVTRLENVRRAARLITHCAQGHEYTPENTAFTKKGHRTCVQCNRESCAARYIPKPRPRKTHCKHGHEFTPENTRISRHGAQCCRACHRAWQLAHYHRSKGVL